jgi:hypothetical protein
MLTAIRHTVIWTFLAVSILALPVLALLRQLRWAVILHVVTY